ncbi:uncharacterized protein DS421_5g147410 [Arachis hypogaea]|nr:uncharacterized protein DS421_5g147410 [Arachis hypogaea]
MCLLWFSFWFFWTIIQGLKLGRFGLLPGLLLRTQSPIIFSCLSLLAALTSPLKNTCFPFATSAR